MKDQELIALADKAELRVLAWIEEGLVPKDPAFGVCDILALLRDRVAVARSKPLGERRVRP